MKSMKCVACITIATLLVSVTMANEPATSGTLDRSRARTSFQSFASYDERYDIRSDVVMVYGVTSTTAERIAGWKAQGYRTELMTGAAWGGYADYIQGRFDGKRHEDEGQAGPDGKTIWHDPNVVPYMVPTPSYVAYLISLAKQAIDAGAEALHFEEPEFWSRAGYSEGFKRLWAAEYGEPWRRPDSSPDAFWCAAKLKYLLYKRTLADVFAAAKEHARTTGRDLKCYVPTHSLLSYSQWNIVSPETSLMDLPNCDGYIAQVWTGTARTHNRYRGVSRERTFETAFLEYASMHAMTAPTGRTVYFLADPVEDDPNHTWDDYRANYERVIVASLLFPGVSHFEVMPWPDRVFLMKYPAGSYGKPGEKITIPPTYASELMCVVNALNEMEQPECKWESGTSGIAVLASDTMMFQRGSPWSGDIRFDEFYGLALPLVKHGVPAQCVVLEQVLQPDALKGVTALLMSYDHIKPLRSECNARLAEWVRAGGVLLYYGDDSDTFTQVREWWNATDAGNTPRRDLMRQLQVSESPGDGVHPVGKGFVHTSRTGPAALAQAQDGPERVMRGVREALGAAGSQIAASNHILLRRGPFVLGAVLDESISREPLWIAGRYVDLFTSESKVVDAPMIQAGQVFLLRTVPDAKTLREPVVLASSARVESVEQGAASTTLHLRGPRGTPGVLRLALPDDMRRVEVSGGKGETTYEAGTALVRFDMSPRDVRVTITRDRE